MQAAHLPRRAALAMLFVLPLGCGDSAAPVTPTSPLPAEVTWLQDNAHALASLSIGARGWGDLEGLRAAVGDARVVMLGEQSHGDGTTFLAKSRIVQFLHEEMGFDVLAWEGNVYSLAEVNDDLRTSADAVPALQEALPGMWSVSEQVQPLLQYIAGRRGALRMAGFDPMSTGALPAALVATDIERMADGVGFQRPDPAAWSEFLALVGRHASGLETATTEFGQREPYLASLHALHAAVAEAAAARGDAETEWWERLLRNMEVQARINWARFGSSGAWLPLMRERDAVMADNAVYLADHLFAGSKIILWAASFHVARDLGTVRSRTSGQAMYPGDEPMGVVLHRHFGSAAYVIGFTAYEGRFGRPGQPVVTLAPAPPGSIEQAFDQAGFTNAFLDFRRPATGGQWFRTERSGRMLGHADFLAEWPRLFDGVVYTKTMIPSKDIRPPYTGPR